jgi:alkylation response protein AidB-like acyl-CoA dehydrogenase
MSEPGAGSDLKAIRTTEAKAGDEYVINGSKTFISNGLNCDLVVVVAKTDPAAGAKGVSLFLVEADRPGFRKGRKLDKIGQHAADTAELFFDEVRVPAANLLGELNQGFIHLMQELAQERFIIAIGAAATMEAMLTETIRYTRERKVFGQTVFDFQNSKFKLAELKAKAAAMRIMVDFYLGEHLRRRLTVEEAAIAKLFTTETLCAGLDDMLQLHGGYGYMTEYPIARAYADARVSRIYGGTSEVMRTDFARFVACRQRSDERRSRASAWHSCCASADRCRFWASLRDGAPSSPWSRTPSPPTAPVSRARKQARRAYQGHARRYAREPASSPRPSGRPQIAAGAGARFGRAGAADPFRLP